MPLPSHRPLSPQATWPSRATISHVQSSLSIGPGCWYAPASVQTPPHLALGHRGAEGVPGHAGGPDSGLKSPLLCPEAALGLRSARTTSQAQGACAQGAWEGARLVPRAEGLCLQGAPRPRTPPAMSLAHRDTLAYISRRAQLEGTAGRRSWPGWGLSLRLAAWCHLLHHGDCRPEHAHSNPCQESRRAGRGRCLPTGPTPDTRVPHSPACPSPGPLPGSPEGWSETPTCAQRRVGSDPQRRLLMTRAGVLHLGPPPPSLLSASGPVLRSLQGGKKRRPREMRCPCLSMAPGLAVGASGASWQAN